MKLSRDYSDEQILELILESVSIANSQNSLNEYYGFEYQLEQLTS